MMSLDFEEPDGFDESVELAKHELKHRVDVSHQRQLGCLFGSLIGIVVFFSFFFLIYFLDSISLPQSNKDVMNPIGGFLLLLLSIALFGVSGCLVCPLIIRLWHRKP